jgi:Meckel syndrome type 1 protein
MEFISQNMTYIVAAAVVIAALLIVMMIARAFGGQVRGRRGSRLGVSEYYDIDNERQLILIRRDDREHLLLIGGNQDLVVEAGIEVESESDHQARTRRASLRREPLVEQDDDNRPIPLRPAPRPAIFGERTPSLRPVDRDEPKLGSVSTGGEDADR